jgi:RimJ/RimL family protein N-acetyltransferase
MVSIRGTKTILTEVNESDAEDILTLRNNPAHNKFLFQKPITIEEQLDWIKKNKDADNARNFKVTNINNEFKGTISIYNIVDNTGEFGRYIVTNPINAIEAEYLLLKLCFESLGLSSVYCQTNLENKAVWGQHVKLGFRELERKEVAVGSFANVKVIAVVQEITAVEFRDFNYDKILKLIKFFD